MNGYLYYAVHNQAGEVIAAFSDRTDAEEFIDFKKEDNPKIGLGLHLTMSNKVKVSGE